MKKMIRILLMLGAVSVGCPAGVQADPYGASPFGMLPATVIPPVDYDLDTPYDYAMDMGVGWDRRAVIFLWSVIQPDLDVQQYQWGMEQELSDTPIGMGILANISIGVPDDPRYTDYAVSSTSFLPSDEAKYKAFVRAVVDRYDGDGTNDMPGLAQPIKAWQVDNEPPHGLSDYPAFLKMTYEAVKEADPDAIVVMGGIGGMPPVSTYLQSFTNHFLPILDAVAAFDSPCFDVFDFHWYGEASGDYLGMKSVLTQVSAALDAKDLTPALGYWITEMGTYSGDPKPLAVLGNVDYPFQTERQQAVDLVRRNVYALSLGVRKIFMAYGIPEGFKHDEGYFDFTGLVYDGEYDHDEGKGVKKLSYYAYKKMSETLAESGGMGFSSLSDADGVHVVVHSGDTGAQWIVWNDRASTNVTLTLSPGATGVVVSASVPSVTAGKWVTDYASAFTVQAMAVTETVPPRVTIALPDDMPLYVEQRLGPIPAFNGLLFVVK